jgi:hypothetical protein
MLYIAVSANKMFVIFLAVSFIFLSVSCQSVATPIVNKNNTDVISYREFFLDTNSLELDTSVRGTVFVKQIGNNSSKYEIQIVSWVEIDPGDGRGIGFYVPRGWAVSGIDTSFPEGNLNPELYTSIWSNKYFEQHPEKGQPTWIQIGGREPTRLDDAYGQGNVIITLISDFDKEGVPDDIEIE